MKIDEIKVGDELYKIQMSYKEMIDTLKGLVFGSFDRTTAKERKAIDLAIAILEKEEGQWLNKSHQSDSRMDMLKNCAKCRKDCPLRSVDGLIEKLQQEKRYKGKSGNPIIDAHDVGLDRHFDMGLDKAIHIINEYMR